jgi:hypothetical protein
LELNYAGKSAAASSQLSVKFRRKKTDFHCPSLAQYTIRLLHYSSVISIRKTMRGADSKRYHGMFYFMMRKINNFACFRNILEKSLQYYLELSSNFWNGMIGDDKHCYRESSFFKRYGDYD